jgi:drug/metabolite transporter (DMT)-like permease
MNTKQLTLATAALMCVAPFLWAANTVVARYFMGDISPMTLNFLRWAGVFIVLLPLAGWVLKPGSALWQPGVAKRFFWLAALGVGTYNALQYLALNTSTPNNINLVGGAMPMFMMLIGLVFYKVPITRRQVLGTVLSLAGVAVVLTRGDVATLLHLRFVPGDAYILLGSLTWAGYSWMLARPAAEPKEIRGDWAAFLLGQVAFGLLFGSAFAAAEWALPPVPGGAAGQVQWSWALVAGLVYIILFPSLIAQRTWGLGIAQAGPTMASFFANLTPLFSALMSAAVLGEMPQAYHALAFLLIVGGIYVSSPPGGRA